MRRIAIIGAGLSGLVLARRLDGIAEVTVFDRAPGHASDLRHTRAFREFLQPLLDDGVVSNWSPAFAELDRDRIRDARAWNDDYPHYVGTPRMSAIGKYLSRGLAVNTNTRIAGFEQASGRWTLLDSQGNSRGDFDWVILTTPAPQAATLADGFPELVELCEERRMRACFALMLGFEKPLELPWEAAVVRNADISWMCVNSSKPGRSAPFTLLVHSTNAWADRHVDDDAELLRDQLLDEASAVSGHDLRTARHCDLHRWRFANMDKRRGSDCYIDHDTRLAACGDWFLRGRVEAAFTSAFALHAKLRESL